MKFSNFPHIFKSYKREILISDFTIILTDLMNPKLKEDALELYSLEAIMSLNANNLLAFNDGMLQTTPDGMVYLFKLTHSNDILSFIEMLQRRGFDTTRLDEFLKTRDLTQSLNQIFDLEEYNNFLQTSKTNTRELNR